VGRRRGTGYIAERWSGGSRDPKQPKKTPAEVVGHATSTKNYQWGGTTQGSGGWETSDYKAGAERAKSLNGASAADRDKTEVKQGRNDKYFSSYSKRRGVTKGGVQDTSTAERTRATGWIAVFERLVDEGERLNEEKADSMRTLTAVAWKHLGRKETLQKLGPRRT